MPKAIRSILLPLILIWLFAVVAFYYWGHQFMLIRPVISIVRSVWLIAVCAFAGLGALGLGALFSKILRVQYDGRGEFVVLERHLAAGIPPDVDLAVINALAAQLDVIRLDRHGERVPQANKQDAKQRAGGRGGETRLFHGNSFPVRAGCRPRGAIGTFLDWYETSQYRKKMLESM